MKYWDTLVVGSPCPPGESQSPKQWQSPAPVEKMDEGVFHCGPEGYSAKTAYSEIRYGSGFDEDADWNEEN